MPRPYDAENATWVGRERERRGVLQGRLARDLGVSQQSLSGYERGVTRMPDDVAARLASVWGLRESDVRREMGLYVPLDAPAAQAVTHESAYPEDALRLPKGVKLSDLAPNEQALLGSIVDAFIESVRREAR